MPHDSCERPRKASIEVKLFGSKWIEPRGFEFAAVDSFVILLELQSSLKFSEAVWYANIIRIF